MLSFFSPQKLKNWPDNPPQKLCLCRNLQHKTPFGHHWSKGSVIASKFFPIHYYNSIKLWRLPKLEWFLMSIRGKAFYTHTFIYHWKVTSFQFTKLVKMVFFREVYDVSMCVWVYSICYIVVLYNNVLPGQRWGKCSLCHQ